MTFPLHDAWVAGWRRACPLCGAAEGTACGSAGMHLARWIPESEQNRDDLEPVTMSPINWPCPTLRHLAAVYADHPDYQEAWKP